MRDGVEIAYVREGEGGFPLLLLHGWPETKRIWWRNIEPLAEAGFEVIVPDLRGFGDSGLAPDGFYDPAAHARDLHALVHDVLGHERCAAAGGDVGGVVVQDLGLRFEGFVERQCLFNTVPPLLPDEYEAAGIPPQVPRDVRMAADYFLRQGRDADELAAELDTPDKRRRYIAQFYGSRFWAAPGTFTQRGRRLHDRAVRGRRQAARRASASTRRRSARARPPSRRACSRRSPVPTLLLYGPEDHVIPRDFPERCEVAFTERIGPFVVPRRRPLPAVGAGGRAEPESGLLLRRPEGECMPVELQGSTALVTGATGGIGQAIVRALHARGATVIAERAQARGARGPRARARRRRAAGRGPRRDPAQVAALVVGRRIDVLVANAALPASGRLDSFTAGGDRPRAGRQPARADAARARARAAR